MYIIPTMHSFTYLISINDDWPRHIKKLGKGFPQLTEEDLHYESGKENELLERIEARLNIRRKEVLEIIKRNQVYQY